MATIAEQLTSLAETKTAIKGAIVAKGVQMADTDTFRSYADKIGQIQAGGGEPATKFGASVDMWIGDVDENGVLQNPTLTGALNFTGVNTVGDYGLYYKFCNTCISSVNADSIKTVGANGFYSAFSKAKNLTTATFSGISNIDKDRAFYYCFSETADDLVPSFPNLKTINGTEVFYQTFNSRVVPPMERVFPALEEVSGARVLGQLGKKTNDNTLRFVSLKKIAGNASFSSNSTFYAIWSGAIFMLPECVSLTGKYIFPSSVSEIHFAAKNQAEIEASEFYSSKWGAGSSCTIYFDL